MKTYFYDYVKSLFTALDEIDIQQIDDFSKHILNAYNNERNIYVIGNGGSASSASHMTTDFGKGTAIEGLKRIKMISLTDNTSIMTAIANDISYEEVFKFQLETLLNKDEVVIAISASGNSENVVRAVEYANKIGAKTLGILGFTGGKLLSICNSSILVKSFNYGIVEDMHMIISHSVSQYIKSELSPK